MQKILFYPIGKSKSSQHCVQLLRTAGIPLIDHPSPEITHLLLDIPSSPDNLETTLSMLPPDTQVIGGNLSLPNNKVWDFLKDESYLAKNAAITAHCALKVALPHLTATLPESPTLVIGWGRIGKCLAGLLKSMGCSVTVAARNPAHRAMLEALGYQSEDCANFNLDGIRLLFNTVPEPILCESQLLPYPNLVKIELASRPGLEGSDIIKARGLPGIYAPETSGKLQFETILRYLKEEKS